MRTAPESRKVGAIVNAIKNKLLIPKPDFQRRAVWTNPDKVAFIETILSGYPFPEIYVAAGEVDTSTGDTKEVLVDGQQRVRTIDEYFRGAAPFKRSGKVKKYSDLEENEKKSFLSYDVSVRNLGILDEKTLVEVFNRMNATSYDLNDMERYNAVYLGEFKRFSEQVAQEEFFRDIRLFSATDIRRMKDISYIASITVTLMSDYFHRDDEIEEYLERYNESFPERQTLEARVSTTIAYLRELDLPKESRAWKKADFYTLFVEIDRQLNRLGRRPESNKAKLGLSKLYDAMAVAREDPPIDAVYQAYFFATLQNTNDRSARLTRGQIVRDILERAASRPE